jgi:NADPH:quinone reductase
MPNNNVGKKLVLTRYGQSREDAVDNVLKLEDSLLPEVTKLQPHDVLVGVRSASVSFIDLLMMSGQYQTMLPLPCVPGMEYAGVVLGVGSEVDPRKIAVGDRVLSDFIVTGPRSLGAYQAQGGWQSYAVAPDNGVHRFSEGLTFDQACNLAPELRDAVLCVHQSSQASARRNRANHWRLRRRGMAAIQVAKILGATVIATGRSDEKLAQVKAFGADHVINTSPRNGEAGVPKFRDDVKALTGGRGAEVVFDTVGGDVSQESLRSLAFGGRTVIVGWAGNTTVAQGGGKRGSDNADRLPTNIMQMKGLYVMGSPMVIHSGREPDIRLPRLESIFKWVGEGRITPYVSHTFPLAEYRRAMHAKLSGEGNGNCVLHPN